MKRRILAVLAALAVCLTALSAALAAGTDTSNIYHLVINDSFFDETLNAATMPIRVNGVIYVPYSVFDRTVAGADFKISYGQQRTDGAYTLTLYSINGALIFDLNQGTTTDVRGSSVNMRAILHNGRPFIPIQAVCAYFNGLAGTTLVQYVYTDTEYGAIIRLRNEDCQLSDYMFRQSALSSLRGRLNRYLQGQAAPPTASPSATSTPARPTASQPPEEEPEDTPDTPVCLALRCDGAADGLASCLDTLSQAGITALLLFRPEDLEAQAALVRRGVGEGHTLGLIVPGSSPRAALDALEEGDRLLEGIAWTHARCVLAEDPSADTLEALDQQGVPCWQGNVDGASGDTAALRASRILAAIGRQSAARVTMDASALSADALARLIARLEGEGYPIRPAVETQLQR